MPSEAQRIDVQVELQRAGDRDRRERQEDREQEQRHRGDELRALPIDVATRQPSGMKEQFRQRAPDLPFEMKDAVQNLVTEREKAAVQVRGLPAIRAIGSCQRSAAVETRSMLLPTGFRIGRRACRRFHCAPNERARQHVTCGFGFSTHRRRIPPQQLTLLRLIS